MSAAARGELFLLFDRERADRRELRRVPDFLEERIAIHRRDDEVVVLDRPPQETQGQPAVSAEGRARRVEVFRFRVAIGATDGAAAFVCPDSVSRRARFRSVRISAALW